MLQNKLVKKSFLFITLFFLFINADAQSGIFFQAVARDNNANPAKERKIYIETNIIQSSPTGTKVLIEEHQTYTDAFGIFNILVGSGTRVGGTVTGLSTIEWSKGPYYLNLKIVITPVGVGVGWDYTKEWVDIGTTIFGTVPFALYSANTANINEKLNATDTTKMLEPYAKGKAIQVLSTTVDTKLATKDTAAMLAPYAKLSYNLDSNFLKKQIASLLGPSDTIKYTKQIFTDSALLKKMNVFDTSIYAKQNFVETSLQSKFNLVDTIKYTKQAYTDSALLTKFNLVDTINYAKQKFVDAGIYSQQKYMEFSLATKLNSVDTIKYTKQLYVDAALTTKFNSADTIKYAKKAYSDSALLTKLNLYDTSVYAKKIVIDAALTTKLNSADTINYTKKAYSDSALLTKLSLTGNALTATTAGNITASSNTTLTSLTNLNTVGAIKTGVWSATTIDIAHGGTGITTAGRTGQVLATASDGTLTWTSLTTQTATHSIGESFGGGIVFYVWDNGRHGLIAATSNLSYNKSYTFKWGPTANYVMALRDGINAGIYNTERIIMQQGAGNGTYAAMVAAHYQFNGNGWGGYGDWYLPSKYELSILYQQRNTVGGFNSGWIFWSSTEADDKTAWSFDFVAGTQQADSKILTTRFIRAIRSF